MSDNDTLYASAGSDSSGAGIDGIRILLGPAGHREAPVAASLKRVCDTKTFTYTSTVPDGVMDDAGDGEADYLVDPSIQDFDDLLGMLPPDWRPDYVINLGACRNPILPGMELSDIPLVGIVGDWDRTAEKLEKAVSAYDCVFVGEARAVPVLRAMGCRMVQVQSLLGCDPELFEGLLDEPKAHDVTFIGGLDGHLWRRRGWYLERLAALSDRYRVFIRTGIEGEEYRRQLAASRIVFNCPVRGEVNNRCFEAMAAGALLLTEDNPAVRELLSDRLHCILYNEENLEDLIDFYLTHDEERETIASAGRAVALQESYEARARLLLAALVHAHPDANPANRPFLSKPAADRHLALSVAAMVTNQRLPLAEREARASVAEKPTSPEPHNNLGCILLRRAVREENPADRIRALTESEAALTAALELRPEHVPAMLNLAALYQIAGRDRDAAAVLQGAVDTLARDEITASHFPGLIASASSAFRLAWQRAIAENITKPYPALARERGRLLQWAALTALGDVSKRTRNLSEASICYGRAVRLVPDDGVTKRDLAHLAVQAGDLMAAVRMLEIATEAVPLFAAAWYDLGRLYLETNLIERARRHIDRCIRIARAIPQLSPGLSDFEALRSRLHALTAPDLARHPLVEGEAA
jgi:tetratricopeptide (TPR) repeat protein